MSFARPGQIVVSRSYYDVVSNLASEYAKLFHYEGSRTDKHVREHEIYVVGHHEGALQKAKDGMKDRASSTTPNASARPRRPRRHVDGDAAASPPSCRTRRSSRSSPARSPRSCWCWAILVVAKKPARSRRGRRSARDERRRRTVEDAVEPARRRACEARETDAEARFESARRPRRRRRDSGARAADGTAEGRDEGSRPKDTPRRRRQVQGQTADAAKADAPRPKPRSPQCRPRRWSSRSSRGARSS